MRLEQRRTGVLGKPHSDNEGIATSRARSSFSRGISAGIAVAGDGRELTLPSGFGS